MSFGHDLSVSTSNTAVGDQRTVHVQVWADLVCPWCYIGMHRLQRAVHLFEHPAAVEVRYRSFELDPSTAVSSGRPVRDVLAERYGGGAAGAQEMLQRVADVAAADHLVIDVDAMLSSNSFDAHRLVQLGLASGGPAEQSAVMERFFAAHFAEGRALDDHPTLQRLGAEAGLDERRVAAVLAGQDYVSEVRADEAEARRLGISGVPFYVADDRLAVSGAQPVPDLVDLLRQAWTPAT